MTLDEALEHMSVLYDRRINGHTRALVCQCYDDGALINGLMGEPRRAQFLNLVIVDERNDRWISLRLSTFRKVVKFIASKDLLEARRLKGWERMKLDGLRKTIDNLFGTRRR